MLRLLFTSIAIQLLISINGIWAREQPTQPLRLPLPPEFTNSAMTSSVPVGVAPSFQLSSEEKPGECPQTVSVRDYGWCVSQCRSDMNCSYDQKCCFNGCGTMCMTPVSSQSNQMAPPKFGSQSLNDKISGQFNDISMKSQVDDTPPTLPSPVEQHLNNYGENDMFELNSQYSEPATPLQQQQPSRHQMPQMPQLPQMPQHQLQKPQPISQMQPFQNVGGAQVQMQQPQQPQLPQQQQQQQQQYQQNENFQIVNGAQIQMQPQQLVYSSEAQVIWNTPKPSQFNGKIPFEGILPMAPMVRQCPSTTLLPHSCQVQCNKDIDCGADGLCCSSGCGKLCISFEKDNVPKWQVLNTNGKPSANGDGPQVQMSFNNANSVNQHQQGLPQALQSQQPQSQQPQQPQQPQEPQQPQQPQQQQQPVQSAQGIVFFIHRQSAKFENILMCR